MQPYQAPSASDEFSPFAVAQNLVHQFLEQELSASEFSEALERYHQHVIGWAEHLESIPVPESEEAQESKILLEGARQGVELILQGAEILGQLTQESSEEVIENGLQTVLEGQKLLQQVQEISDQNITSAIDDARYMD